MTSLYILKKEPNKKIIQELQKLDILYLEQLLNSKDIMIITWYQLKKIKELNTDLENWKVIKYYIDVLFIKMIINFFYKK